MYAIATGRAERNPAADLRGAIPRPNVSHMSSITDPKQVGELLRAIDRYPGSPITRCALQLTPHVFLRSKEIRFAEWSEFDFAKAEWRIPLAKMKGRKRDKETSGSAFHLAPLATQVIDILREVQALTGQGKYLFPGLRSTARPMSDATLTNALRRMGYSQEELHVHGLRATARTLIRQELGCDEEPIERQLGHAVKGPLGAAYILLMQPLEFILHIQRLVIFRQIHTPPSARSCRCSRPIPNRRLESEHYQAAPDSVLADPNQAAGSISKPARTFAPGH